MALPRRRAGRHHQLTVTKSTITLTYDEALYIADLLAVAADAASNEQDAPDTFPAEARLATNVILSRTDD